MTVLGIFVCVILGRSLCKCTLSIAFDMFGGFAIVLSGVFFLVEACRNCCIHCLQGCYDGVIY